MRDYTGIYVAPQYDEERRLIAWRYELLRNGKLQAHAEGFETPEKARIAGQRKALEEG